MSASVQRILWMLALVLALAGLTGCAGLGPAGVPADCHLTDEQSFQNYTVRVYGGEGGGFFEILRNGRQVYSAASWRFGIDRLPYAHITNVVTRMGRSINGDGQPNLVVEEWTGGAHCCFVFRVFEIGDRFRLVATIDAADSDGVMFRDLRGDGNLEFVMNDWAFAYWNTDFARSPAPEVILRYRDSKYVLDTELMRKPVPTTAELATLAEALRAEFKSDGDLDGNDRWYAPPTLWGAMLDLIYAGNSESAWQLCDLVWPADWPGKPAYLHDFRKQLATSPYYRELSRAKRQSY